MDEGLQFPKHITCQCSFTYIGKYQPSMLGKHYELNWLEDKGYGINSSDGTKNHGTFTVGKDGDITNTTNPNRISKKPLFEQFGTEDTKPVPLTDPFWMLPGKPVGNDAG